jgi:transcriptional regulator with XRE-family HTH domain
VELADEGVWVASRGDGELGLFLRSRRERLVLGAPGTASSRRRTPGLRREEVALRADISVEWYTRLEQGRGGRPSTQVLASLAAALELTPAEREHLYLLSVKQRPATRLSAPETQLEPQFQEVLDSFPYSPAYMKTASWDIVGWNRAASIMLTDYAALPLKDRNVLRILFTDPTVRTLLTGWEHEATLAVSTFRLELSRLGAVSSATSLLIDELLRDSAEFARRWRGQDVGTLGQGVKRMAHPTAGVLEMRYTSYAVDDHAGLGLVLYTPHRHQDRTRMQQLLLAD